MTRKRQPPQRGVDSDENHVFRQNDALKHGVFQKQNALSLVVLTGCKANVPSCDDKKVGKLLSKILEGKELTLVSNAAITTVSSDDRVRVCKSLMTARESASTQTEQIGVVYEINLADNNDEFRIYP